MQTDLLNTGLQQFDTRNASDHFPKVTDYSLDIITNVEEETTPTGFMLEQNYPNPFNPSTIIKFSIPFVVTGHAPYVQLKVYDTLGSKIASLVNEELPAGEYEVTFDAAGLPSGMYFYTLIAGSPSTGSGQSFVETKKMLILK